MSAESVTPAVVTALAERIRLTARGWDDMRSALPAFAPLSDPESVREAWGLLTGAGNLLGWIAEGATGESAWDDVPSLAVVLADVADVEGALLRFRLAVTARIRELHAERGDS